MPCTSCPLADSMGLIKTAVLWARKISPCMLVSSSPSYWHKTRILSRVHYHREGISPSLIFCLLDFLLSKVSWQIWSPPEGADQLFSTGGRIQSPKRRQNWHRVLLPSTGYGPEMLLNTLPCTGRTGSTKQELSYGKCPFAKIEKPSPRTKNHTQTQSLVHSPVSQRFLAQGNLACTSIILRCQ